MKANSQVKELDIFELSAKADDDEDEQGPKLKKKTTNVNTLQIEERGVNGCFKCPFIPIDCDSDVHIINFKNILSVIGRYELLLLSLD